MNILYALQNIALDLSQSEGAQLHIRGVMQGIHHITGNGRVVGLRDSSAYLVAETQQLGLGSLLNYSIVPLALTSKTLFLEKGYRFLQTITGIPYLSVWDSLRIFDACRSIRSEFDILHAHYDYIPLGAALASRNLGIPLILDCEGDWFDEYRQMEIHPNIIQARWAKLCQRYCFDTSKVIICVSEELKYHLMQNWDIPEAKLFVLPNGVDLDLFSAAPIDNANDLKSKYGLANAAVIMFVGGFYDRHALDQLVTSFNILLSSNNNCKLVLVGDGPTRNSVHELVKSLGIEQAVIFTGKIGHKLIPELLAVADILVSPSLEYSTGRSQEIIKTSPLKLFEYMATGKACIATATGQQKKYIRHGENGILVPPGNVGEFASAMQYLLANPAERERLGRNAQIYIKTNHSWQSYGDQLRPIYETIFPGMNSN